MDELKPCPFCGNAPYVAEEMDPEDWWFIECRTINCVGPGVYGRTSIESAIDKWNRRAALAATQAGWISVKDRLPEKNTMVLCAVEFDGPGDWRIKTGYLQDMPDFNDWYIFGGSWSPSHWRELPAAPESSEKDKP